MFNQGFGSGAQQFEQLSRQYWTAWGEALRGAAPGAGQPGVQAWQEAIDWWTRQAHGGRSGINEALDRFNTQARDWFAHMQQVAAQFAGRDHTPADIAHAWKQALGAVGANPFPEMLRAMRGKGLAGLDQWMEDASPWLQAVRGEGMAWLRTPAFGAGREHQERLQQLAAAAVQLEQANSAYNTLLLKASERAFALFEDRLGGHAEPGRQIESARALFDLWVDAAEEAYAEIALSPEFRHAYGELVNAQMRLRAALQRQVEQLCTALGMPTRTEVDAAHRKIVDLERALRRLRDRVEGGPQPAGATADGAASRPTRARAAGSDAARSRPAAKSAAVAKKPGKAAKSAKAATGASPSRTAKPAAPGKAHATRASAAKSTGAKADGRESPRPATRKRQAPKRAVRKLAPRPPSVSARPPPRAFAHGIAMPDAPLPLKARAAKRGAR